MKKQNLSDKDYSQEFPIIAAFALQGYLPASKRLPCFIDISPLASNKQGQDAGR